MAKLVSIAPNGQAIHLVNLDNVAEIMELTVNKDHLEYGGNDFIGCKEGDPVTNIVFCAVTSIGSQDDCRGDVMTSLAKIIFSEFIRRIKEEVLVV